MLQATQQAAIAHATAADAGVDREVHEVTQPAGGPPAMFGEGSTVHISVETDGHAERLPEWHEQVGARPARFGRSRDEAIGGRKWIEIDRAERCDVNQGQRFGCAAAAVHLREAMPAPSATLHPHWFACSGPRIASYGLGDRAVKKCPTNADCEACGPPEARIGHRGHTATK